MTFEHERDTEYKFMGLQSKNRKEWTLLHLALMFIGGTSNAMYDTLGTEAIEHVINTCQLKTIACTSDVILNVCKDTSTNMPGLRNYILFDTLTKEKDLELKTAVDKKFDNQVKLYNYSDIIEAGKKVLGDFNESTIDENHCALICWTSGTTGTPKGVKMTHGMFLNCGNSLLHRMDKLRFTPGDSYLSYLPSAHSFEQALFSCALITGCKVGYFGGNILKVVEDLQALKPTMFATVPRLLNRFYDKIKGGMDAATGCKKFLVNKAVASKMAGLKNN